MKRFEKSIGESRDDLTLNDDVPKLTNIDANILHNPEKLKDYLFDQYMKQQLLEDFFESLAGHLNDDEIDQMRNALVAYSDKEIYAALSLPHELRERRFDMFEKKLHEEVTPKEIIDEFVTVSSKYEFGVGYHTSPVDIRPDEDEKWVIKGTEIDHRDNDRKMAYYSSQYRHMYKKRSPEFIYIIRTDPTHGTDGNWSRSDSLSVVARVPFEKVFKYVESTAKQITAAPSEAAAAD